MTASLSDTATDARGTGHSSAVIYTPDQRVRVFISSTLEELAEERRVAQAAVAHLRLTAVLFERGARPHPPQQLYRAYLAQSDIFIGIYWQRYGWVGPGEAISGLDDEFRHSAGMPRLIYVKTPAPERDERLQVLLDGLETEAVACYKTFRTLDELQELIENDLALLLTESFAGGRAPEEAAPQTTVTRHHNLPVQRSSLVDREAETTLACRLLLRDDVGLVTLTGTGGSGKTRLALHVAVLLLPSFDDGVWLVSLASLANPNLVASRVAHTLSVPEVDGQRILETLQDHLRDKHMLLVLDNFEHLLAASGVVSSLLECCPRLKILATSRCLLRIREEKEVAVLPLLLPDRGVISEPDDLERYSAIALFVQRARDVDPGFTLTREMGPTVLDICRRLDGLPLAIELAAAHIKFLPPRAMLRRLNRRLPLLKGGARDLPVRQQTLHNTIAWSHDLLGGEEQSVFRQLAVFAGGFTLDAAEAICRTASDGDANRRTSYETLAHVQVLLDHSMIQQRSEPGSDEPRFGMLETIREYANDLLIHSGEAETLRRRHTQYFLDLAKQAEPQLTGPDQEMWLSRVETEHDNLRAALDWSRSDAGDPNLGLQLVGNLWRFWYIRGYLREGIAWLEVMLAQTDERVTLDRVKAIQGLGALLYAKRKYPAATVHVERALAMYRDLGDREGEAACLNNLAVLQENQGDMHAAYALHEEALSLRREMRDKAGLAITIGNLGALAHFEGNYERARPLYEEGLELERELGNIGGIAISLANLGELSRHQGDWETAVTYFHEGLALGVRVGDPEVVSSCLDGLGCTALHGGDPGRAARLHGAAEASRDAIGSPGRPEARAAYEADIGEVQNALSPDEFAKYWGQGRAMGVQAAVAYALESAAEAGHETVVGRQRPERRVLAGADDACQNEEL